MEQTLYRIRQMLEEVETESTVTNKTVNFIYNRLDEYKMESDDDLFDTVFSIRDNNLDDYCETFYEDGQ